METLKEFSKKHRLDFGTILEISRLPGYKLSKDSIKYPYWRFDDSIFDNDVVKLWEDGYVCLNHAITPERISILRESFEKILSSCKRYNYSFDGPDSWPKKEDEIFEEMEKISEKISASGILKPGYMFRIGVADGCAYYVVTKVNKKSVHVELRTFYDAYHDNFLGAGRKISMTDFENCYALQFNKPPLFKLKRLV